MSSHQQILDEMDDFDFGLSDEVSPEARRQRRWRMLNPERYRLRNQIEQVNCRARRRGARGRLSVGEWTAILELYLWRCLCCGKAGLVLTVDHVIPLEHGGSNTKDNVQPLCQSCNCAKGVRHTDYRLNRGGGNNRSICSVEHRGGITRCDNSNLLQSRQARMERRILRLPVQELPNVLSLRQCALGR
jgi:5-methylcytosine-specific restriction endonuclease McrA